jgi:hypothetical protein
MFIKALGILGIILTALGTVLLWLGSPSGYALSPYGGGGVQNKINTQNRVMNKKQIIAVTLIIIGSIVQATAIICA